jgi:LacI family transcriptional regulator
VDKSFTALKPSVRIKDIAERANVSVGTVDRVLHNRGEVAPETRALINKIIEELGYKPNIIASTLAQKKQVRIAVLMPSPSAHDSYWQQHLAGIERAEVEISHFGVSVRKYYFDIQDQESFLHQCEALYLDQPDGVLIMPVFEAASQSFVAELTSRKIPFSFIDSVLPTENKFLSFNGQDSYKSGFLAAKLMSYGVSKETTVLIIKIGADEYVAPHHLQRIQGFKAYLEEHNITETKIRTVSIPSASEEDVKKALTQAFTDYSFVRGLFVTDFDVHRVAKFVEEKKLGNIRLIGYDLLEANIHYLKKGVIDFLISQRPASQGYKGLMNLFNHLVLKQTITPQKPMPIDIITKENVDYNL